MDKQLLSLSNLQMIHFSDVSITKIINKVLLLRSQQFTGKAQILFHLGTRWPWFFCLFVFGLSQSVKCFFFQTESDVHLPMRTIGQGVSFVPTHLIAVFFLSSVAKEPKQIFLLSGPLCLPLVLSWNCFEFMWGHRPLNSLSWNLPNRYLSSLHFCCPPFF